MLRRVNRREDLFVIALILLVGFGGFGLGRLSTLEEGRHPIIIDDRVSQFPISNFQNNRKDGISDSQTATVISFSEKQYVASVKGKKYHFPWCSGAQRIKEGNKIWFGSKEEAERAGYEPAKNCKGL